ncbi:hypothetical protein [Brevundimonas variabilis]|uniref:DGQHR domain-containing protein n=1 Tax=Brevundimonas variabilis TaxID=74312 RepID=A0A7W9CKA3_9CAUL|nr:hypothetical protein [Brevundimonas variabilis]MBB5747051.1 hypothetical protein [Brevundimonas variabilis]
MIEKTYEAVLVQDGPDSKPVVLFSAPATDVEQWIGVPQRLMLGDDETVGFQRTVSDTRREALAQFFSNPDNIIQNPLLGAIRAERGIEVEFTPTSAETPNLGHISIKTSNEEEKSLKTLFGEVRQALEARELKLLDRPFPVDLYQSLEGLARSSKLVLETQWQTNANAASLDEDNSFDGQDPDEDADAQFDEEGEDETSDLGEGSILGGDLATAVEDALEQTHITEFWDQLRAREKLAENLGANCPTDALLGFTREVLISYLRPIILVDGQHRLAGAVEAALRRINREVGFNDEAAARLGEGVPLAEVLALQKVEASRRLPMSVTLNHSPAEHVFQFVVVNQRATPVPKALLGTIVSTSLNDQELDSIRRRLEKASIPVEGSQVVAALTRNTASPFFGLVARGFDPDNASKLPWSVVGSLAEMFRLLKGGIFYHQSKPDHAATWAKLFLPQSQVIDDWSGNGFKDELAYWRDPAGPWQPMFVAFWIAVRDRIANVEDPDSGNYWGNPRTSNLFNKPSLTILQTDFFAYLVTLQATLDTVDDVNRHVAQWLKLVDSKYFARDWKLGGVKKDAVGTRRTWAELWSTYRQSPIQVPRVEEYRALGKGVR